MAAISSRPAALPRCVLTYTKKLENLSPAKVEEITRQWRTGTSADVDKWTAWVGAAKSVGLDLDDLQPVTGKEAKAAQNDAMNAFIDTIFSGLNLGYLRSDNEVALKAKDAKRLAIIKVRRSEMRGVIEFGNLVGDMILDAFRDPSFKDHKATAFSKVVSACRKARDTAGETGRKLTKGEILGVVEAVLAPAPKDRRTPEQERDFLRDRIVKAIDKLMTVSALNLNDRASMIGTMDVALGLAAAAPVTQELPTAPTGTTAEQIKAMRAADKAGETANKAARKAAKLADAAASNAAVEAKREASKLTVAQLAKRRATSASNNVLNAGGTREDAKVAANAAASATTETADATKARKLAKAAKVTAAKARKLAAAADKLDAAVTTAEVQTNIADALKNADEVLSEI